MDTFGKILADAQKSKAEALELLKQLDDGKLRLAHGMTETHAREILRLNLIDYEQIIARFSGPKLR